MSNRDSWYGILSLCLAKLGVPRTVYVITSASTIPEHITVESGLIKLHGADGRVLLFDSNGLLTQITDRNNNSQTLTYNNLLSSILDNFGRQLSLGLVPLDTIVNIRDTRPLDLCEHLSSYSLRGNR